MKLKILLSIFLSLILSVNIVTAQKKNKKIVVTGHVLDGENKAIVGATILVDNKNTPSYTDENGFYKVKVKPNADLIAVVTKTFQFIEKSFEGQTTINFSFSDTIISENTTKNTDNSKESDIALSNSDVFIVSDNESSVYNNIYEMIQNRVPGVEASGNKILIRGINRIGVGNVDNSPIFVVDGMPINSIDHIMPGMVKSITFLKGSASAKYGSRGVNGAIIIKLKKGDQTL